MKKIAFLEYVFMFDPSKTWSHLSEFEATLARFFSGMNMEAEIMLPIGGQEGRRILYIRTKDQLNVEQPNPVGRPKTLGGQMRDMKAKEETARERDFGKKKVKGFDRVMKKAEK